MTVPFPEVAFATLLFLVAALLLLNVFQFSETRQNRRQIGRLESALSARHAEIDGILRFVQAQLPSLRPAPPSGACPPLRVLVAPSPLPEAVRTAVEPQPDPPPATRRL